MASKKNRCSQGGTYRGGHRCAECREAIRLSHKRYILKQLQRERGAIFPSDQIPAQETVDRLNEAGRYLTNRDMARLTGLREESISRLRAGRSKTVRRSTADVVRKSLENPDIIKKHPNTLVDATWVKQMILSLSAQGYTIQHQRDILQNNLHVNGGFIKGNNDSRAQTYYKHVEQMRWLVRAVGDSRGPSKITADRMRARGVFPTKHYDGFGKLIVSSLPREMRQGIEGV